MTLKVVQGLVGSSLPNVNPTKQVSSEAQVAPAAPHTQGAVPNQAVNSEAVVTSLRSTSRSFGPTKKIGDYDEAKKVANDTASEIRRQGEDAVDAQRLDTNGSSNGSRENLLS